jgi:hypothetical protein
VKFLGLNAENNYENLTIYFWRRVFKKSIRAA